MREKTGRRMAVRITGMLLAALILLTAAAGAEAPAMTPEGKLIGAYRLHIWDMREGS